jgi:hypothetical protein
VCGVEQGVEGGELEDAYGLQVTCPIHQLRQLAYLQGLVASHGSFQLNLSTLEVKEKHLYVLG